LKNRCRECNPTNNKNIPSKRQKVFHNIDAELAPEEYTYPKTPDSGWILPPPPIYKK